ncbi:MAG: helix-turn-helix transcriptional regulator [Prolixibacteraceae bacterium]|jgi:transcriptional regulator with XRE-family HTH domain
MEERIRKFMEYKGITSSELADSIGVQRSNVTHVLKARNKPSFQFIEKILQVYPELNAKWLLLGTGNMVESLSKNRTLFDHLPEPMKTPAEKEEKVVEKEPESTQIPFQPKEVYTRSNVENRKAEDSIPEQLWGSEKPIERLIVFYKDQTFKVYNPSR